MGNSIQNLKGCIIEAVARLSASGITGPDNDARILAAHVLGISTDMLFTRGDYALTPSEKRRYFSLVSQRQRHRPLAYIVGYRDFYRDRFITGKGHLVPRPDTEHILYAAEEMALKVKDALDIGTGTGALAVSLTRLYPDAGITALDISTALARRNVNNLNAAKVSVIRRDYLARGALDLGPFDLVVSNPPYLGDADLSMLDKGAVLHEPRRAFYGGADGLQFYIKTAWECGHGLLRPGGALIVETDHKWADVVDIFTKAGLDKVTVRRDYSGLERVVTGIYKFNG